MEQQLLFMPISGGENIGASCYFLRIGNANIILDAGVRFSPKGDQYITPNFFNLFRSGIVQSFRDIHYIFISHAHMDHLGYLSQFLEQADNACVYMTEMTSELALCQLAGSEDMLRKRITSVSFGREYHLPGFTVKFYPAGHTIGAMMVLFQCENANILYTGDFNVEHTLLTQPCVIPQEFIDFLILCGTHTAHKSDKHMFSRLYINARNLISEVVSSKKFIAVKVSQLTKGIELLKTLNYVNKYYKVPIFISSSLAFIIDQVEKGGKPILEDYNYCKEPYGSVGGIYLVTNDREKGYFESKHFDFSLHNTFGQVCKFIDGLAPVKTYVVHDEKIGDYEKLQQNICIPHNGDLISLELGKERKLI